MTLSIVDVIYLTIFAQSDIAKFLHFNNNIKKYEWRKGRITISSSYLEIFRARELVRVREMRKWRETRSDSGPQPRSPEFVTHHLNSALGHDLSVTWPLGIPSGSP